ncbi:tyrosine-type recombinase/integrase [Mediterraneibacter gnavus]|uniref:Tyrosine-type recombinase/integrase n=1 Tax=Mediterraneibacter gnavus TaxID=33038 RepID=A0A9X3HFT8_MEDGN|nr:tyrosine-type recombinase/integrase [Mediterraneibacter gnavus]MCZ7694827.1 tyrosine-type recombinase/integrase [Mediterraneibacter gnavus]MCZ7736382.1 tyrosine-type recombinase/integrase [Mediterraneibacter gnavus]MDC6148018.1 tyrosine-type recombinase/integrase [Mediterraneibacter gnavus]MDE1201435.1 tyrosine-type recombinase/integrase [Mediterraneibacter gnavus]
MGKDLKGKELGRGLSQRPDGRYMGRAQVEGKPIVLYGWKVKELKKELARAVDDLKRSNLLPEEDGTGITLSEWFEEWYSKYKAPTLKDGGSPAYKRKFLNYYGVRIGSKYLADIRQLHVQTAIADMVESGRSSKSIREATGILQNCIEAAIANGLMRINPVVGTIVPKCEKVERRVLTVEEQKIFLDYLAQNKSWYEELYKFMLLTGLRIGEVGGLQWEDIDFSNRFIYVKRTLSYQYEDGKKTMRLTSPKTENSVRKVPFFGETQKILEQQFEKVKRRKKDLGDRWRKPEEMGNLVFLTSMGSPIGRYNIESDMRYITQQINDIFRTEALYSGGIPKKFEKIHPHALRHTFATRCFEKGMTPRTVQEIMGHANYNTTVSYTHVLDDIKLKEAERLGDFLENGNNNQTLEYNDVIGIL